MKNHALFSSKDKSKNNKESSAAIFVWRFALRVKIKRKKKVCFLWISSLDNVRVTDEA